MPLQFHFDPHRFKYNFTLVPLRFHFDCLLRDFDLTSDPPQGKGDTPLCEWEYGELWWGGNGNCKGALLCFQRISTVQPDRTNERNETERFPGGTHPPTSDPSVDTHGCPYIFFVRGSFLGSRGITEAHLWVNLGAVAFQSIWKS